MGGGAAGVSFGRLECYRVGGDGLFERWWRWWRQAASGAVFRGGGAVAREAAAGRRAVAVASVEPGEGGDSLPIRFQLWPWRVFLGLE